jgi:hypothetical protein
MDDGRLRRRGMDAFDISGPLRAFRGNANNVRSGRRACGWKELTKIALAITQRTSGEDPGRIGEMQ